MADLIQYYGTGPSQKLDRSRLPASGQRQVHRQRQRVRRLLRHRSAARSRQRSLGIAGIEETFDVITTVKGGGVMGQADAVKLGIARALMVFNPELRKALKAEGLVTRDSRGKERKKYGQKGRSRSLPVQQEVIAGARKVPYLGPHSLNGCRTCSPAPIASPSRIGRQKPQPEARSQISLTRDQSRHRCSHSAASTKELHWQISL